MRGLAVIAVLLAAGCSLPIPEGVQVSRGRPVADSNPGDIQVLPPGPRPGAGAEAIVRGFLGAESSPEGSHAIARRFLAPGTRWADDEVRVYDPASLRLVGTSVGTVEASFTQLARIDREGLHVALPRTTVTESYQLAKDRLGEWRITAPPPGVRLTPADRERSFPARRLYFTRPAGGSFRVVPDQVLLPAGGPPGQVEIRRLLRGPSASIAGSVTTAFPSRTRLLSVDNHGSGTYDVMLSPELRRATPDQRRELSAQLVWTLRSLDPRFRGMRLRAGPDLLAVPGEGEVQRHDDWDAFDPEGIKPGPAYFLAAGRLRTYAGGRDAPVEGALRTAVLDRVAVSPDRMQVALLQTRRGVVTVRRGPLDARALPVVAQAPGLSAPSWGSGERGLWLLDSAGQVLLLDPRGRRFRVPVEAIEGPLTSFVVSRDGTRAALVQNGSLYVGRVAGDGAGLVILAVRKVTHDVRAITEVVWRDPTTLVVLGQLSQAFVPVVISVDGSSVRPLPVAGLPARPGQLASSSLGTIVTGAGRLYLLGTLGFRAGPVGRAPAYPG